MIRGKVRLLGDDVNTDVHCSSKYLPGKDIPAIAAVAFDGLAPGFAGKFERGDVIVAGRNFGNNSSREQAVHILHAMGCSAIVAVNFSRAFFRNAINNGMPVVECDMGRLAEGDAIEIDLAGGTVRVPARDIVRKVSAMPREVMAILTAGGLHEFLRAHPDWSVPA